MTIEFEILNELRGIHNTLRKIGLCKSGKRRPVGFITWA